ncbi:MAG: hypothetical protein HY695_13255 [Deltaproteobacteria bacterium]|nr:hypothetical protein [Deltaproteobacteria bacterium]
MGEEFIEIIDPAARRESTKTRPAVRKSRRLDGKCVGLLDNNKPNADRFLEYVGELIRKRHEGVEIIFKRKMTRTEAECLQELAEKCDIVITAFAD